MRAREFVKERKQEQLDEILPVLAAGAGLLARGAAAAGGAAMRGAAAAGRGVTNLASKATKAAGDAATSIGTKATQAATSISSKAAQAARSIGSKATQAAPTTVPTVTPPVTPATSVVPTSTPSVASNVSGQSSTGGQVFNTPSGTKHFANPNNPNLQVGAKPTSAVMAKDVEAGLADKFGVVPTSGINTGIQQATALANTPGSNQVTTPASAGSNTASDIGQQSSTGGQTFQTATGTKHFSNPNNPNQKFADPKNSASQTKSGGATVDAPASSTSQPQSAPAGTTTTIKPVPSTNGAPSIGQPVANKNLANLGNAAELQKSKDKPGFLSGLSKGFKQGVGMDPTQSLARGLAVKGLQGMNMNATASTVANPPPSGEEGDDLINQQQMGVPTPPANSPPKMPSPGSMIKDPRFGNVKVLQGPPGKIKLDTTKTLGYPITIDPKDLNLTV